MTTDSARAAAERWLADKISNQMFLDVFGELPPMPAPADSFSLRMCVIAARIAADFAFRFGLATRHEDIEWIWAESRDCGCSDRIVAHIKEQFPWAEAMKEGGE